MIKDVTEEQRIEKIIELAEPLSRNGLGRAAAGLATILGDRIPNFGEEGNAEWKRLDESFSEARRKATAIDCPYLHTESNVTTCIGPIVTAKDTKLVVGSDNLDDWREYSAILGGERVPDHNS